MRSIAIYQYNIVVTLSSVEFWCHVFREHAIWKLLEIFQSATMSLSTYIEQDQSIAFLRPMRAFTHSEVEKFVVPLSKTIESIISALY